MASSTVASSAAPRPGRRRVPRPGLGADRLFRTHSALVFLFLYVPIGLVVLFSFTAGDYAGELRGLSLRWYGAAFDNQFVTRALSSSLQVGFLTGILSATFGTIAALALQRVRPRIRTAYDTLTYVAIVIPGIVIGIASLVFFVNLFGFLNPLLEAIWPAALGPAPHLAPGLQTIVGAHTVFAMAIVIVLVRTRLAGMDRTLVEASADLFATPWRTFRQITLPQLSPAILAGFLLSFTFSFDEYVITSFVKGNITTIPIYVFSSIRRPPVKPDINAIATVILAFTLLMLVAGWLVYRRGSRRSDNSVPVSEPTADV
ncbi:MAG: ABC transporter permease [Candidatus Limnocylindrales bacterium]